MKISVVIPTYEMRGRGVEMLENSFFALENQDYKDFEVIISDHSVDDYIFNSCLQNKKLDIKYIRNEKSRGSPSANANNGIMNSSGELIKILCQDDYLYDETSLRKTVENFDYNAKWLVSANWHTKNRMTFFNLHTPKYNERLYLHNTIGTHSCLTMINDKNILFDENLTWFMDCEYFYRLYKRYGLPKILKEPTIVVTIWEGQITNTLITDKLVNSETNYILNKIKGEEIE